VGATLQHAGVEVEIGSGGWPMCAVRLDALDVELSQPVAESVEQVVAEREALIVRPDVGYIEAEPAAGKRSKTTWRSATVRPKRFWLSMFSNTTRRPSSATAGSSAYRSGCRINS
jgi:hypothetical protein